MASIDRTELTAFRAYIEDHRDDILELVLRGAPSLQHFSRFSGVAGELVLEWDDVADIVKPWSATFTVNSNQITRTPIRIRSHFHKVEHRFTPKLDLLTYKGKREQTKQSAMDYPYAQWAMEKLARKIKTEQEFDQIWTGDEAVSPTTANEILNGLLTLIADDLAAGTPTLTPVSTGVLASSTIIEQVEQMDDAIDEEYRSEDMAIFCAPEIFRMYRRAYREAAGFHPGNPDTDAMDMIQLDGTSTQLISAPGMQGSQRLIMTPKSNIYYAYNDPTDDSVFEMEQDHRHLDVWCDYWFGVGFLIFDERIVYVNDQA